MVDESPVVAAAVEAGEIRLPFDQPQDSIEEAEIHQFDDYPSEDLFAVEEEKKEERTAFPGFPGARKLPERLVFPRGDTSNTRA